MDDATGQLGNNGTEISYLVSGENGVRFAISKMAQLPPRGAVIEPFSRCNSSFARSACSVDCIAFSSAFLMASNLSSSCFTHDLSFSGLLLYMESISIDTGG